MNSSRPSASYGPRQGVSGRRSASELTDHIGNRARHLATGREERERDQLEDGNLANITVQ